MTRWCFRIPSPLMRHRCSTLHKSRCKISPATSFRERRETPNLGISSKMLTWAQTARCLRIPVNPPSTCVQLTIGAHPHAVSQIRSESGSGIDPAGARLRLAAKRTALSFHVSLGQGRGKGALSPLSPTFHTPLSPSRAQSDNPNLSQSGKQTPEFAKNLPDLAHTFQIQRAPCRRVTL